MLQAALFPQAILDLHQDSSILLHGRLTTHRNDGCWFVMEYETGDNCCKVTLYSPFDNHDVVDNACIHPNEALSWLDTRVDW